MTTESLAVGRPDAAPVGRGTERCWTLLTNHAACLLLLARREDRTLREIAIAAQITERSAARILSDLRADGYLSVHRQGRRNRYSINYDAPLRHPAAGGHCVGDLFARLLSPGEGAGAPSDVESVNEPLAATGT